MDKSQIYKNYHEFSNYLNMSGFLQISPINDVSNFLTKAIEE